MLFRSRVRQRERGGCQGGESEREFWAVGGHRMRTSRPLTRLETIAPFRLFLIPHVRGLAPGRAEFRLLFGVVAAEPSLHIVEEARSLAPELVRDELSRRG